MANIKNQLQVSVSNGFVDEGDGLITFPAGLTITDGSTMRSGTRYDIPSLDISNYPGQVTADHVDSLQTLIGKVQGVQKQGDRVFINGIRYAVKESATARLAYDLLVGGFSNSFSIETMGPWPDETDNTYYRHELVGLSQVVVPNNYNAKTNQFNEIVHNSLERSQQDGLDVTGIEEKVLSQVKLVKSETVEEESMTKDKKNNSLEEKETPVETTVETKTEVEKTEVVETEVPAKVETENEAPTDESKEQEAPAESEAPAEEPSKGEEEPAKPEVEVKQEAEGTTTDKSGEVPQNPVEAPEVKEEVNDKNPTEEAAAETREELKSVVEDEPKDQPKNQTNKNIEENLEMTKEEMAELVAQSVAAALKPVQDRLDKAEETAQNAFDAAAKEPEFTKPEEVAPVENSLDELDAEELFSKQLNAAVMAERMQSVEARKALNDINARNLNALKEAKIVNRATTLEDLGNFVIAPELFNEIVGVRTPYNVLLDATNWKETQSLQFAWLSRTADIDMQPVAIGALGDVASPDTSNNRLKPVSSPAYTTSFDKLEEMAAVTPISINVIKFAAADILADVAEGYRHDYDRKRAQLVVARLQQAVNVSGQKYTFDISDGLVGWAAIASNISDATTVGTLIMNNKTLTMLKGQALANYNASILADLGNGTILGLPFIVVPNDLLPTLNTNEVKHFNVQGQSVTIDQAVFYGDLRTFTGRSSGGLKYDVDGSASYEIDGQVFSAYQRNEVVLRGSFFRGGVVRNPAVIASIPANAVS